MVARWISGLTLLCVLALPTSVKAGDGKAATTPAVLVRVRSLDTVFEHLKTLVSLAGQEEISNQIEGLIKAKIGAKGLEGIDPKRPFGAYAKFGKELDDIAGVILVPIADEKAFLALLENLNFKATKGKNDIYSIAAGGPGFKVDVYFRFANGYAYITALTDDSLSKANLLVPAKVFAGNQTAAISATIRIDQIPDAAKLLAMAALEDELNKIRDQKVPDLTKTQHALSVAAFKELATQAANFLKGGSELTAELDVNPKSKELVVSFNLTGLANSKLADSIADLGKTKSLFGGLKSKESAVSGLVHATMPVSLKKTFEDVVDEGMAKALKSINDENKRKQADRLIKALMPTLKAGELDAAADLSGPGKNKTYTLVAGVKLKDGDHLAKTVRELLNETLQDLPAQARELIKLDADSVGTVKIHRLEVQQFFDDKARDVFGDHPILVAFRNDALFLAAGENGLAGLKNAIGSTSQSSSPMTLEISMARLAPLFAKTDDQKQVVEKIFGKGEEGRIRISLEGGTSLRGQITTRLSVLQFMGMFVVKAKTN